MKIFSNCPSFIYTYAYVYNEKKELIEWAKSKYSKHVLEKSPDRRNAYHISSYERSIYFACKYLSTNGRNNINQIKAIAVTAKNYKYILTDVQSTTEVESLYREYSTQKKLLKNKDTKKPSHDEQLKKSSDTPPTPKKGVVKSTTKTKKTKYTKSVKKK